MPDLVAEFDAALAPVVADPLFRRWGGLVLTSCLLGRHVRTSIREGQPLYPHLFVMLVANSGYGKSTTIGGVREALEDWCKAPQPPAPPNALPPVALAATSITIPRLVHALGTYFPDVPIVALRSRCYAMLADEIGAMLGERVSTLDLQLFTEIYDMKNIFAKQTVHNRDKGNESRARDHYMVAAMGAQPAWIAEALPLSRFQLGMPARTHFVLARRPTPARVTRGGGNWGEGIRRALRPTMLQVGALSGPVDWEPDAWAALDAWSQKADTEIAKWSGLFEGYGTRRTEHAAKLALLFACARVHATIELRDWEAALDLLVDTEKLLPEVLSLVGANPQRPREDQVVEWVRARGEVREMNLRAYMRNFFETRSIGPTLEELRSAGLLVQTNLDQISPHRKFKTG